MKRRLALIFAALIAAVLVLLPTLAPGLDLPGWPTEKLQVSPWMEPGVVLIIDVETEEAAISTVQRDVTPLRNHADRDGVMVDAVRRAAGTMELHVESPEPPAAVAALVERNLAGYDHLGSEDGLHRFVLSEARQREIAARAPLQAVENIGSWLCEGSSVALMENGRIRVHVPVGAEVLNCYNEPELRTSRTTTWTASVDHGWRSRY